MTGSEATLNNILLNILSLITTNVVQPPSSSLPLNIASLSGDQGLTAPISVISKTV